MSTLQFEHLIVGRKLEALAGAVIFVFHCLRAVAVPRNAFGDHAASRMFTAFWSKISQTTLAFPKER